MRVLIVKLTSMGDVLHVMPALDDLSKHKGNLVVDWMVEESFAEIPSWHPSVDKVIPVATRRWRTLKWSTIREFFCFRKRLRHQHYDVVIDAQGLIKSAVFARFAKLNSKGLRIGFSAESIKESFASKFYHKRVAVALDQHAIVRLRQLFAGAFDYPLQKPFSYGLTQCGIRSENARDSATVMFFHATTWQSKHLPEPIWQSLIQLAGDDGYQVLLAWGNKQEKQRAERLAKGQANASVLDEMSLADLKDQLLHCAGAIAVDTGLGHMAAALGTPCVSIYGSTNSKLTGAIGENQIQLQSDYLCSPCMSKHCLKLNEQTLEPPCYTKSHKNGGIDARKIWETLFEQIV